MSGTLITTVDAKGLMDQFADETLVTEYDTGAAGKTINEITDDLLALQVHAVPITKGTIAPTVTRALRVPAGDSILKGFLRLQESVGGYLYVDTARKLQWPTTLGEDKGQQIRYRKNLKGISRTEDHTKLIQRLYPYGAGEGDARIQLDDLLIEDEEATKSADASYGYLALGGLYSCYKDWTGAGDALPAEMIVYEDAGDVSADWFQGADEQTLRCDIGDYNAGATYTVTYRHANYLWDGTATPRTKQRRDQSITHPTTLLSWGRLYLTAHKDTYYTYRVDTVDLSESSEGDFSFDALQLGSTVTVIDEDLSIDVSTTVVKIRHPDMLRPQDMDIELANKTLDLSDKLTEVYDEQQLNQHVATEIGAGQVIVNGVFTVKDWVTGTNTTIDGDHITTDSISLNALTATGDVQSANYEADTTGWKIDAATDSAEFNNVKVRGTLYTTTIDAGSTLTVSGTISAGGGSVTIDAGTGITISGQALKFTSTSYTGYVFLDESLAVLRLQGPNVQLYPTAGHVYIGSGSHLLPSGATNDLGADSSKWNDFHCERIYTQIDFRDGFRAETSEQGDFGGSDGYADKCYAKKFYGKSDVIDIFQDHDDVALLRQIGHTSDHKLDLSTLPVELLEDEADMQAALDRTVAECERRRLNPNMPLAVAQEKNRRVMTNTEKSLGIRGVNILNWQSLLMGAILQLDGRLGIMESGK